MRTRQTRDLYWSLWARPDTKLVTMHLSKAAYDVTVGLGLRLRGQLNDQFMVFVRDQLTWKGLSRTDATVAMLCGEEAG